MPELDPEIRARILGLTAAATIAAAFMGFVSGTSPARYKAERPPVPIREAEGTTAPPARSHAELAKRPWKAAARTSWPPATAVSKAGGGDDSSLKATHNALAARAKRRAFDGAPPVIPHPVRQSGAAECLACHLDGMALGDLRAQPIPHDAFASCNQCHVEEVPPLAAPPESAAGRAPNSFNGLRAPDHGARAYAGAPPTIPHTTWLREQCESCHGTAGRSPLRTPHPERQSCQQCHLPSASLNQRRGS